MQENGLLWGSIVSIVVEEGSTASWPEGFCTSSFGFQPRAWGLKRVGACCVFVCEFLLRVEGSGPRVAGPLSRSTTPSSATGRTCEAERPGKLPNKTLAGCRKALGVARLPRVDARECFGRPMPSLLNLHNLKLTMCGSARVAMVGC